MDNTKASCKLKLGCQSSAFGKVMGFRESEKKDGKLKVEREFEERESKERGLNGSDRIFRDVWFFLGCCSFLSSSGSWSEVALYLSKMKKFILFVRRYQ